MRKTVDSQLWRFRLSSNYLLCVQARKT